MALHASNSVQKHLSFIFTARLSSSSLITGLLYSWIISFRVRSAKRFFTVTSLIPFVVGAVITFVNGNIGAGVAIGGAFGLIRFRSARDYDLVPLEKGDHWIDLALGEFPLFVKKNRAVPLCAGGESSELLDDTAFTLLGQIEKEGVLELYRDDGRTTSPDLESGLTRIALVPDNSLTRKVKV